MTCVTEYDKRISVESLSGSPDAHGHVDNTDPGNWSEYAPAFAKVQSKGGREFWKVNQVQADVSHVWRCPWSPTLAAVTPAMRLVHGGRVYEILSAIDVDLASEEIEIQTRQAVV